MTCKRLPFYNFMFHFATSHSQMQHMGNNPFFRAKCGRHFFALRIATLVLGASMR